VTLYAEVAPDGRAVNLRVLHSLGLGLDESAIEAVPKWKFQPGYKGGKAVPVAASIDINFRLGPQLNIRTDNKSNAPPEVAPNVSKANSWPQDLEFDGALEKVTASVVAIKIPVRQKNSWVDSGSGNLPSE
jgi:TonB family protein